MDAYDGCVSDRLLAQEALAPAIADMEELIERDWRRLEIEQDLGLGRMLWLARFFPDGPRAKAQTRRAFAALDAIWVGRPGYSAGLRGCEASSSPSPPITVSRPAFRRQMPGRSGSLG